MIRFKQFREEQLKFVLEADLQGYKRKEGEKFLNANGFFYLRTSKHMIFQHEKTKQTVKAWGHHGKEIEAQPMRSTVKQVKDHHAKHGLPYIDISEIK